MVLRYPIAKEAAVAPPVSIWLLVMLGVGLVMPHTAPAARAPALSPAVEVSELQAGPSHLAFDAASDSGLVVWNGLSAAGGTEILGRRITSQGRPLGPVVQISQTPDGLGPGTPKVAFNPRTGSYLVVWISGARNDTKGTLRARFVDRDAQPLGASDFSAGDAPVSYEFQPSVAAGARNGGYLVAAGAVTEGIEVRALDDSGGVLSSSTLALSSSKVARSECGEPNLAYRSAADEYMLAFACGLPDENQPPQTQYVQRLAPSAVALKAPVVVIGPRYTKRGTGETALAYNPHRDEFVFVGQTRSLMRTRRLRGDGKPIGPVRTLKRVSAGAEAAAPTVGFDPRSRRYLVTWVVFRRGRTDVPRSLFATRLSEEGVERGPESLRRGDIFLPTVVARGPSGGFLLVFSVQARLLRPADGDVAPTRTLVRYVSR